MIQARAQAIAKALQLSNEQVIHFGTEILPPTITPALPLSQYIDHTVLKPQTRMQDVQKLCAEALEHDFVAICINLSRLEQAKACLQNSKVKIAIVVGFPLGATSAHAKAQETKEAIAKGATEIDMVINVGKLLDQDYAAVLEDVQAVVQAAQGHTVKVILETGLLSNEAIVDACILSVLAGAHYVKTSTGFVEGGAKLEHVQLMRQVVGSKAKIKASGGVRTYENAIQFITHGCDRIGTSNGVAILKGKPVSADSY